MAWNDVPKPTVVKCFIKAGILNSERKTNAAEVSDTDLDPFSELEINIVEDLAKETSGTDVVSIKETLAGCFDPPMSHERPENWEHSSKGWHEC